MLMEKVLYLLRDKVLHEKYDADKVLSNEEEKSVFVLKNKLSENREPLIVS